jgi:predicted methyltransferase
MLRTRLGPLWLLAVATAGAVTTAALAQGTHPVSGRRIATVMSHQGAAWLERPEREAEEAPTRAIAALGIKPGQTVADIGAGSGYYSVLLADAVGSNGRVYATDIQPEMLALVRRKLDARAIKNIELVLGTPAETRLPDGAIDLALMVDVYHELESPRRSSGR